MINIDHRRTGATIYEGGSANISDGDGRRPRKEA